MKGKGAKKQPPFLGSKMGLINNIYVLCEEESVDNEVETVTHPTESGMPTSDTIRRQPVVVSLKGKIVDTETTTAEEAISKIKALQKVGSVIKYVGAVGTITNLQIQSFHEDYNNKNYGGADFDMTLHEIKTAKSAYVKQKKYVSTKGGFSLGDKVRFKGGNVYVASDAKNPAANRSASRCELTLISNLANATHIYHLVSVDGGKVYGWVDANRVEAISSSTASSSNGGTQQVQKTQRTVIYHTVKSGETLWGLCYETYKEYGLTMGKVFADNPEAFPDGTSKSLKVGAKLKLEVEK